MAVKLELEADQHALLVELLESDLGDLRAEIVDTDNSVYHDRLKQRERLLASLLRKVKEAL
jgi:hypothetical protein